jgi:hypothetical protein
MRPLGLFLRSLAKRWWALLSSAVFTFIGPYGMAAEKSNHWVFSVSIIAAVISFVVASFGAWSQEHVARISAEKLNNDVEKRKATSVKLAALMRQEPDIRRRLELLANETDFTNIVAERDRWIAETIRLLREADLPTDAEAFSQIGDRPPVAEDIFEFRHLEEWKRDAVVRLSMYRKRLNYIIDNRRL